MTEQTRYQLSENDLPKFWYNLMADSPVQLQPFLNPMTMEPVTPEFLNVLFPMDLIEQEVSTERSFKFQTKSGKV
jgi:tryptophan synthase beta chain